MVVRTWHSSANSLDMIGVEVKQVAHLCTKMPAVQPLFEWTGVLTIIVEVVTDPATADTDLVRNVVEVTT